MALIRSSKVQDLSAKAGPLSVHLSALHRRTFTRHHQQKITSPSRSAGVVALCKYQVRVALPSYKYNMPTESPGIATPSGSNTIYGAISRVTYTKTVTEPGPDSISSISASFWPSQSTTPVMYTSLAAPSDPTSENFPNPLPIFIATYVEVVEVNTAGLTISTLIEVPSQPAYVYGASILGDTETCCTGNFFTCWSTGKRAGIVIAVIMGGLFVLIFLIWFCCFMQIHGSQPPDEEESHGSRMRERERDLGEDEDNRRKRVSRSNHEPVDRQDRDRLNRRRGSALSETCTEPPRPLPRMVTADGYREERRVSRLPRHIHSGALSVSSAGAVLGVEERNTRRDGMFFPEKAVHGSTVVDDLADAHGVMSASGAAKDSNTKMVPTMAMSLNPPPQIRPNSDMPYRKLRSISENYRDVDQQERGRSLGRKHSSRKVPPRLQRQVFNLFALIAPFIF